MSLLLGSIYQHQQKKKNTKDEIIKQNIYSQIYRMRIELRIEITELQHFLFGKKKTNFKIAFS